MSDAQFDQLIARIDALEARLGVADKYLDAKQAAVYLGISVRRIYAAVRTGTLTHVIVDQRGTVKTKKAWLDEWFTSKAAR
jgi:excisionase family DNA binding protein